MAKSRRNECGIRAISSAVERFVHIEDVSGSNPLSPTMFFEGAPQTGAPSAFSQLL
jgi:hypothetical protein